MSIINYRPTWSKTFIDILESIKKRSLCIKLQTAAMIVKGTQILAIGYNGTFSKCEECYTHWLNIFYEMNHGGELGFRFEDWIQTNNFKILHREWSKMNEIHAESNALKWISKYNVDSDYIIYTLYSPCDLCAKEIISYGIKTLYYKYEYKHGDNALKTLKNNGVICIKI